MPGHKYSFGVVKAAEARGDFAVLVERDRRAFRVHLGANVAAGLHALETRAHACAASVQPESLKGQRGSSMQMGMTSLGRMGASMDFAD